jgi:uncharacterized cupredoxin-like copper-binding protein
MSEACTTNNRRVQRHRFGIFAGLLALMVLPFSVALADDAPQVLKIDVGSFYFQLAGQEQNAPIHLKTGVDYEIQLHNADSMLHEVQIGRDPGTKDGHPHDYQTPLLGGVEWKIETSDTKVEGETLTEIELQPGATASIFFNLPASAAGTWEMGCFQPGHYEDGMHAPVIVE